MLWLWYRPAAIAPIQPLAWELPYAAGAALKRKEKKRNFRTREALGDRKENIMSGKKNRAKGKDGSNIGNLYLFHILQVYVFVANKSEDREKKFL